MCTHRRKGVIHASPAKDFDTGVRDQRRCVWCEDCGAYRIEIYQAFSQAGALVVSESIGEWVVPYLARKKKPCAK